MSDIIIVELDKIKLLVYIHHDRTIGLNRSKPGPNGQILRNSVKVFFGYRNQHGYFNVI